MKEAPSEVAEARELLAAASSVGEDGKLRPEVHKLLDDLTSRLMDRGPEWVPDNDRDEYLAGVRDPSGVNR